MIYNGSSHSRRNRPQNDELEAATIKLDERHRQRSSAPGPVLIERHDFHACTQGIRLVPALGRVDAHLQAIGRINCHNFTRIVQPSSNPGERRSVDCERRNRRDSRPVRLEHAFEHENLPHLHAYGEKMRMRLYGRWKWPAPPLHRCDRACGARHQQWARASIRASPRTTARCVKSAGCMICTRQATRCSDADDLTVRASSPWLTCMTQWQRPQPTRQ